MSASESESVSESVSESKCESKVENKQICTFYQRGSCTKGDGCKFSHIGSTFNENTSTSAGGAKSKAVSVSGAKPKTVSAGGSKSKADSAVCRHGIACKNPSCTLGSHPSICLAGFNCQGIGTTCMCRHFMMCSWGYKCKNNECGLAHGSKCI